MYGRKVLLLLVVLALISPLFGVIGSELVDYHEPLDIAAELLGREEVELMPWSPFPDYFVPGFPENWFGASIAYIICAFIGLAVITLVGTVLVLVVRRRSAPREGTR